MNVTLPKGLEKIVEKKVKSGFYPDASAVVGEALRLLNERDQIHALKLTHLREAVGIGQREAATGEFAKRSIDEIIADNERTASRRRK